MLRQTGHQWAEERHEHGSGCGHTETPSTRAAPRRLPRRSWVRARNTSGSHVVIGRGGGDKHTLAHELTHVIQQRQGPVAGTDNGSGLRVSDPSDRFEREAEANAQRVMRGPAPTLGTDAGGATQDPQHAHAHAHAHVTESHAVQNASDPASAASTAAAPIQRRSAYIATGAGESVALAQNFRNRYGLSSDLAGVRPGEVL
ncbi:eCIS core domain-containing protein [Streptomyces paludis]